MNCVIIIIIVFNRRHTIYVIFHSLWFHPVPRALIADAWSFQTLTAILDHVTHFASISCCIDPMANKMNLDYLKLLYCTFQKYEVMTRCVVGGQPKKKKTCKYELQSNKTHQTHFLNQHFQIPIRSDAGPLWKQFLKPMDNKHNSLSLAAKICSDICPWTLSVPRSSQFSSSFALRKLFASRNR